MTSHSSLPDPILRNPVADLLAVGCLVGLYESCRVWLQTHYQVSAHGQLDGFMRSWGESALPGAGWAATALLMGLLFWRCLVHVPVTDGGPLQGISQVGGILLESLGLALALWVVARFWGRWIPQLAAGSPDRPQEIWIQTVSLIGAAIYEELIFRVLFLTALYALLLRFGTGLFVSAFCAVLLSAIVFSMAHHPTTPQNAQDRALFLFRAFCGSILGVILLIRGPGTAIYSHALYNLIAHFTAYADPA